MSGTFTIPEIRCNRHFYGAILCANQAQAPINEGIVAIEPCAECISNAVETLTAQRDAMAEALRGLFKECAMIHRYGGEIYNGKEADEAIKRAVSALALADGAR